jgi:L-lactate utilization protein LutB
MVFILVDAGRTNLVGGDMQECCAAPAAGLHEPCPENRAVGDTRGWVHPGPMGSVLRQFRRLERRSTCPTLQRTRSVLVACPVKIRCPAAAQAAKQVDLGLRRREMLALRQGNVTARRPRLYALRDGDRRAVPAFPRGPRRHDRRAALRRGMDPRPVFPCAEVRQDLPVPLRREPEAAAFGPLSHNQPALRKRNQR